MNQTTSKNIVAVATDARNLTTLVKAIKVACLVETLKGIGPFTVFAPSDEAFAKLPVAELESLLADKERLTEVLTYHVVPGQLRALDVIKAGGTIPATVNGLQLELKTRDNKISINGAAVVMADIEASNGVIHVIDAVMLPKLQAVSAGR